MPTLSSVLAVIAAYLIGSLSFAVIVSRVMGLNDPRRYGSGNPGATNVLRSGNKAAALLTLALDALKGFVPVMLVEARGAAFGFDDGTVALVGLAAFAGHLWPVFFGFRGGKGVATAAGVLLALNPWLGAATLLTFLIVVVFTRYVSLASVVAGLFAPFYQVLIWGGGPIAASVGAMGLLLIWRHRGNIRKLSTGTENRIGQTAGNARAERSVQAHRTRSGPSPRSEPSHHPGAKPGAKP